MALAFALAVLPPLVLLGWLAARSAQKDHDAFLRSEEVQTRGAAQRARDAIVQAAREAEEACFPRDLGALRSRDPAVRAELDRALEAALREHPIARRFLAFDEDGKLLVPDPRAPYRPEGSPRQDDPDEEDRATDAQALAKRRELRALYDQAKAKAAEPAQAEALFNQVANDADAWPTLRARAALRIAALDEARKQDEAACVAYARAAASPVPVRDEDGAPIRPRAALREAELLDRRDRAEAYKHARDLALALLSGEHRDLGRAEWRATLDSVLALLDQMGKASEGTLEPATLPEADRPSTGSRLVRARLREVEERLAWVQELEGKDFEPLRSAPAKERADELLHFSSLRDPPVLVAFRVLPTLALELADARTLRTNRMVFGVELDLDLFARDVLGPACGKESLEQDVGLAVIDARGLVRAYAGADAAPDAKGGRRATDAVTAMVALDPLPWQLELRRSGAALRAESRSRWILFSALFALALLATALGGAATFRSVARSLELARMKQDFVSNVTHELKTPLTSIRMYAETLSLGRAKDEEKKKEYLEHIIKESERLQRLVDDVLDFARIGEGKKPYVLAEGDVTEVTLEAIDLFRHSAKVRGFELYLDLPKLGALPPVDLDKDALVRSVLNLLSNAVKYSPDSDYVAVAVQREGDHIAIAVSDHGIGIDEEDLDRIFDRFYRAGDHMTRGIPGAGLGLALVDEIVRAHGGRIRVESQKAKGSKFTILLPIVQDYRNVAWPPPPSEEAEKAPEQAAPTGGDGGGGQPAPRTGGSV